MRYADTRCTYEEVFENNEQFYVFTGPCFHTKKPYSVKIPGHELYAYRQGGLIQDTLKSVNRDDREFLISGYSPDGWKQLFGNPFPDDDTE